MDKISIIVPVWNAEKFLHKCIEKICNQTYENLEILLVDDGSTDNSLAICQEYAQKDSRIRVFHKENGGQASARNYALDYATGEFVGFVDDDDWPYPEMYEKLHDYMIRYDADIARCADEIDPDGKPVEDITVEVLEQEEYFGKVYQDIICGHVTDRLFRRNIIGENRFPHSKTIEDMRFMRMIISNVRREVVTNEKLFFYTIREDNTSFVYAKNHINSYERAMEFQSRYEEARERYPKYEALLLSKATTFSSGTLRMIYKEKNKFSTEYSNVKGFLKKYKKEILHNQQIPWKYKMFCFFL